MEKIDTIIDAVILFLIKLFRLGKHQDKILKVLNHETINYLIFGVLTTVVNYIVFITADIFFGVKYLGASVVIAWVIAVLFSFFPNKIWVFKSNRFDARTVWKEICAFFLARLASLGIDMAATLLMVNVLLFGAGVSKLLANVLVIIINYFLSKLIIFKK